MKSKSWSFVLISTDMVSFVSPRWDNDHQQNLVFPSSVVCQHLVHIIQFCRFWERLKGQKLLLEENKVKCKSWSFVLILTDMGSVVSPGWENHLQQNLVIPYSVVCQHLLHIIQFCRFWKRLTLFIFPCLETLELIFNYLVFYVIAKK